MSDRHHRRPPNSGLELISRRRAGTAILVAPALWLSSRARAQTQAADSNSAVVSSSTPERRYTPRQMEGPYYPVVIPKDADFDLLRNGTRQYLRGAPVWVQGTVTDLSGKPVSGAIVEIWQADQDGHYDHPGDGNRADPDFQGFGRTTVGTDGAYRFRTIRPTPYPGRTPHIHFKVKLGQRELLTTQLYVDGDPANAGDMLWRRLGAEADRPALTVPFAPGPEGLVALFPIIVRA
jgi:protocatechuate 3,4-dioxygenase, beta subunit